MKAFFMALSLLASVNSYATGGFFCNAEIRNNDIQVDVQISGTTGRVNGNPLGMLIDRRKYKGFLAVYGQQLAETGQIIGCASPQVEPRETEKDLKYNSKDFLEIVSEVFVDWIPQLLVFPLASRSGFFYPQLVRL